MSSDSKYIAMLEASIPLEAMDTIAELARAMNIDYRKLMGELIWAMVTCHLDISFPTAKMSQHSAAPAKEHYMALGGEGNTIIHQKKA